MSDAHRIENLDQLAEIYGEPMELALKKEIPFISEHYRAFIEAAPFVVIATIGGEGQGGVGGQMDASPRGDPAPVARVLDEHTVAIPDRRGNNRVDTLRNVVEDGRVALLFLIPGVGETLRINGHAYLTTDPALCESFVMQGKAPASVMIVRAESVYYQCPKALVRSKLWDPSSHVDRKSLPSNGEMLSAVQNGFDGKAYDEAYPQRLKDTIY